MQLAGKTTMITGAAGGLGAACARLFAAQGGNVVLFDRSTDVRQIAKEIGDQAIAFVGDVMKAEDLERCVQAGIERFGRIDNLIACSGIVRSGTVTETALEEWQQVIDVNLTGVFLSCQAVLPVMAEQKYGRIVTVSSHFGLVGATKLAAYCAAKGGVIQLTKSIALDYGRNGIRANCLAPGMMQTNMLNEIMSQVGMSPDWVAMMRGLPTGIPKPEQVAQSALYLVSDAAEVMTGSVLTVDGGYTAR